MATIVIVILIFASTSASSKGLRSSGSVSRVAWEAGAERASAASFPGYAKPESDTHAPAAAYAAAASVCSCLPCIDNILNRNDDLWLIYEDFELYFMSNCYKE